MPGSFINAVFIFSRVWDAANYGGVLADTITFARFEDPWRKKATANLFVFLCTSASVRDFHAIYVVFCDFLRAICFFATAPSFYCQKFAKSTTGIGWTFDSGLNCGAGDEHDQ